MIHQPASSYLKDKSGECILDSEELRQIRDNLTQGYVQKTGKPYWVVYQDMERDVFMSATEAQDYGIVDLVGFDE